MTQLIYNKIDEYKLNKQLIISNILKPICNNLEFHWIGEKNRRKVSFQIDNSNNLGFFHPQSHDLIIIDKYDVADQEINNLIFPLKQLLKNLENNLLNQITITNFDNGLSLIFKSKRKLGLSNEMKIIEFAKIYNLNCHYQNGEIIEPLLSLRREQVYCDEFKLNVDNNIFLQPTKAGLNFIINFLITELNKNSFKKIADIYSGVGVYTFSLLNAINAQFYCFEGNANMIKLINNNIKSYNLHNRIKASVRDLFFDPISVNEINNFDNIIINPPRNGCEPIIHNIAKSHLQNLQYISCNPKTFVRDAKILIDNKFKINNIVALDQFYLSDHCEILASFNKIK